MLNYAKLTALALGLLVLLGCARENGLERVQQPSTLEPYRIAETKYQPLIDQCLVQVIVPEGSTPQQVRQWHNEIVKAHRHRASHLFVNYYHGNVDADRMVASNGGGGELVFEPVP